METPRGSRLPDAAHERGPWRIREIVPDFTLEDAWALPVVGHADEFPVALKLLAASDPAHAESLPTRLLWRLRDRLGAWFDLGRISSPNQGNGGPPIPGTSETSLAGRLPEDLRGTATDVDFGSLPFVPLYRTPVEFAAEIGNQTMHGVIHLAWADRGEDAYQAEMAVYVKPRGRLGVAYMALIKPFRHWIVYPALMRQTERTWASRPPRV
jgi:Protein of unknown function (DUF2867)